MANYQTIAPLEGITGKLNKKGKTVFRQKFARDSNGAVIRPMRKEVYVIQNPRDWKKNPPRGAEKQRHDNWTLACQRAKVELMNEELAAAWKQRFQAQLKTPEADAPIDPKTRKPKTYIRLDCFVRAAIFRSLQA